MKTKTMNRELKRLKRLLPLVGEDEISTEEKEFVEEQLRLHPELKDELSEYRSLKSLLGKVKDVPAPASLMGEIMSSIKGMEGKAKKNLLERLIGGLSIPPRRLSLEIIGVTASAILIMFIAVRLIPTFTTTADKETPPLDRDEKEVTGITLPETDREIASRSVEEAEAYPETVEEDIALAPAPRGGESPEIVEDGPPPTTIEGGLEKGLSLEEAEEPLSGSGEATTPYVGIGGVKDDRDDENRYYEIVLRSSIGDTDEITDESGTVTETEDLSVETTKVSEVPAFKEDFAPTLTISTEDPDGVRMDIVNKVLELGGGFDASCKAKKDVDGADKMEVGGRDTIYIPADRLGELFDYIAKHYPFVEVPDRGIADEEELEGTIELLIDFN